MEPHLDPVKEPLGRIMRYVWHFFYHTAIWDPKVDLLLDVR